MTQYVTGANDKEIPVFSVKRLLAKAGSVAVSIYFSYTTKGTKEGDAFEIPVSTTYKFTAPEGKFFTFVIVTSASASTIDLLPTNMNVELIA